MQTLVRRRAALICDPHIARYDGSIAIHTTEMSITMLDHIPAITIRPLTVSDILALSQIQPTYTTDVVLGLDRQGDGSTIRWELVEKKLPAPFDKGRLYDFDADSQANIEERLGRPDDTYSRVADYEGLLVGLIDTEIQHWNNTLFVWNLMVDVNYRRHGIGRRLWNRARDFARQADVRAIMIETQNTNIAACRFYQRMGCQLVGLNELLYSNHGTRDGAEFAIFWAFTL